MQKGVYFILVLISSVASLPTKAASGPLYRADSLYAAKQYTQAFEFYETAFNNGRYSPAMLLRMAYIQEGLGSLGESLYYLNLYYLASDDAQALKKMEELAKKNNLEGYETNETFRILAWLQSQYITISITIAAICIFLLALMFYQRVKLKTRPMAAGIALTFALAVLFFHTNYPFISRRGIVAVPNTYLMSGPSSGASVIAIIGAGHQLEIKGKTDVWIRVGWKDNDVYIRESLVRPVQL